MTMLTSLRGTSLIACCIAGGLLLGCESSTTPKRDARAPDASRAEAGAGGRGGGGGGSDAGTADAAVDMSRPVDGPQVPVDMAQPADMAAPADMARSPDGAPSAPDAGAAAKTA